MLEIVWRNPNRLVRARVSDRETWLHDPVAGQPQSHESRTWKSRSQYELVVSRKKPVCAA